MGAKHIGAWALVLGGCVTVEVVRLSPDVLPARPADAEVDVLLSPGARGYRELARINVEDSGNESWHRLLRRAKLEARRLGADAIILTSGGVADPDSTSSVGPPIGKPRDRIEAVAVAYTEPTAKASPSREGRVGTSASAEVAPDDTPAEPPRANYRCDGQDPIRGELVSVLTDSASGDTVVVRTRGGTEVRVQQRCVALE